MKAISSINGLIKTGVLATMLAGSTALYASNPIKKDSKPNQTEVVSIEGADAIKAIGMAEVSQTSIPTSHNLKLDEALRKYIQTDDDRKYINGIINSVYKKNGTYLGSAIIQHEINFQQFFTFVSKNTDILINNNINRAYGVTIKSFGPEFFKTMESKENLIMAWANDIYNRELGQQLTFRKIPDAIDVSDRLDLIVQNSDFLTTKDKQQYLQECINYLELKGPAKNINDKSNILARKTYIMDKIVYTRLLKKLNVFSKDQYKNDKARMQDYFISWMSSVRPDILHIKHTFPNK